MEGTTGRNLKSREACHANAPNILETINVVDTGTSISIGTTGLRAASPASASQFVT